MEWPPLTTEELSRYYNRIGLSSTKLEPTLDTLKTLVFHHITHINWESVNIQYQTAGERVRKEKAISDGLPWLPIKFDPDDFYDWVVNQGRGGYCFNMNGLFKRVLQAVGFQTSNLIGRIARFTDQSTKTVALTKLTHRIVLVKNLPDDSGGQSKHWIVDMGFGASPLVPIPLGTGEDPWKGPFEPAWLEGTSLGWRLRTGYLGLTEDAETRNVEAEEGVYVQAWHGDKHGWSDCYFVQHRSHVADADFVISNHFVATHPASRFVAGLMVVRTQNLEPGSKVPKIRRTSLMDDELTVHDFATNTRTTRNLKDEILGAADPVTARRTIELDILRNLFDIKDLID
ncbi:hypothetical protein HDU93_002035 [Gonapodya sp. JEL0774]|nr:hypothetical protein HDU93_002035 [Gonapodya sp. JEL0774]